MKKIGMIVALENELLPLLEGLKVKLTTEKRGAYKAVIFKIGKNEVICVNSGVGEISAAAATQYLITAYNPDFIINFGVCGSLKKELGLKTVVFVKGVVHYDFDTSAIDKCEVGKYEGYDSVVIPVNEVLLKSALSAEGGVQTVICASGDKFIADEGVKRKLAETYGASVCEMESAGVVLTADKNCVPCLIVKAVSDAEGGAADYRTFMRDAAKRYVDFLIKFITLQ